MESKFIAPPGAQLDEPLLRSLVEWERSQGGKKEGPKAINALMKMFPRGIAQQGEGLDVAGLLAGEKAGVGAIPAAAESVAPEVGGMLARLLGPRAAAFVPGVGALLGAATIGYEGLKVGQGLLEAPAKKRADAQETYGGLRETIDPSVYEDRRRRELVKGLAPYARQSAGQQALLEYNQAGQDIPLLQRVMEQAGHLAVPDVPSKAEIFARYGLI